MTTGWHIVRDVFCIECKNKLGWMYEMAIEEQQKYKEGQIILENALICKISDGIRDPLGEDDDDKMPEPNIEQPPRTRSPSESSQNSRSNSESGSSGF
uniref:Protein yippee-like n=1 Tax=Caenorhabditis japonica TaxID=281687 RepID=A0A8R1HY75_CAEJA